ncbi:hypothetical protein [Candidatus Symbiopectobacterium sp. 'North America']|uniref:hypothetical protein n=1 Tax=Candidatus Symbiopectobacterium sp. 'North America' TaxID=2794574 RepID=UPI0018CA45BB
MDPANVAISENSSMATPPCKVRLSTSRPSPSVPHQNSASGDCHGNPTLRAGS